MKDKESGKKMDSTLNGKLFHILIWRTVFFMLMPCVRTSDPKAEPSLNRRQLLLMSYEKKKKQNSWTWNLAHLNHKMKQNTPEIQVAWAVFDF